MDEEWIIEQAKGAGGQIKVIYWRCTFSKGGESITTNGIQNLRQTIPSTSSNKEIIQKVQEELGDLRLESIRASNRKRLDDIILRKNQSEVYTKAEPDVDDINRELVNRKIGGTTINIQTVGDIRVNIHTDIDKVGIRGLLATRTGGAGRDRTFIDADGNSFQLSPQQMLTLWGEWDDYVATLEASAKALKDMSPIPTDYDNDSYWQ